VQLPAGTLVQLPAKLYMRLHPCCKWWCTRGLVVHTRFGGLVEGDMCRTQTHTYLD